MAQAKTLTPQEFDRLLAYVAGRSYAMRNRMMILISFWSGMRVGEIANLKVGDVIVAIDGQSVRDFTDLAQGDYPWLDGVGDDIPYNNLGKHECTDGNGSGKGRGDGVGRRKNDALI